MTHETDEVPRIPCVGALVVHGGRLLLVRRGQEPSLGLWSVPGGRLLPGEPLVDGCEREVLEETGVVVRAGQVVGQVLRDAPSGGVYVIDDLLCQVVGASDAVAGDDAADAAWFTRAEVEALDARGEMAPGVLAALRDWKVLDLL